MSGIVVVQTAFLGDVVLTTPLLRALRRAHPGAAIAVVADLVGAAVLTGLPHVDELIAFDKRGREKGALGTAALAWTLRRRGFEIAIAAQRSARTGLLVRATGAPLRIGFSGSPGAFGTTRRVVWNPALHAVRRYLSLGSAAGVDLERADPAPELAVTELGRAEVERALARSGIASEGIRLAIAPGSIWGTKRWTPEGFAAVARGAGARGLVAVLIGSPAERELCERVRALAGSAGIVLAGELSLAGLTALLAGSRALVTNDSGSGHVASAVGTPVVSVFGPTVPRFGYAPWGERNRIVEHVSLSCRPCHAHGPQLCPLGHHRCMTEIGPERVLSALDEILALPSEPRSAPDRLPGRA